MFLRKRFLQIDRENFTWNLDRDEKIDTIESDVAEWFMWKGTWFITNKQSRYVNFAFSRKQKHKSQRRKMPENVLTE